MKTDRYRLERVTYLPERLEPGVLYLSKKYETASHMCACGCGTEVTTPLSPGFWRLTVIKGEASRYPSIGNWSLPCQSHYWITGGQVRWAAAWTPDQIADGRQRDHAERERLLHEPANMKRTRFRDRVVRAAKGVLGRLRRNRG